MAITMYELRKNVKSLEKRVDELCKSESFADGAVDDKIEQLHTKSGSGSVGDIPENSVAEGSFVDGTVKKPERGLDSKGGSGASVGDKFVSANQTGRYINDGSKDKEEMIKGCSAKKGVKAKKGGKADKVPAKTNVGAKKAGVPAPKGGKKK